MNERNLDNWEAFEKQLEKLEKERLQKEIKSIFLYRGHENHKFELSSTLERNGQKKMTIEEYHGLISAVKPQIETFTKRSWNILSKEGMNKWLKKNDTYIPDAFGCSVEFQDTYSYMVYLRHYSFPSPMIDWTSSPYVAAYFAFRRRSSTIEKVSIYVFLESTNKFGVMKIGSNDEPYIYKRGPWVKADKRHFVQKSQYTICVVRRDGEWRYVSHEEAFARCDHDQDRLWKFNIPYSERLKVLRLLDSCNINALSLFESTESLMETMALRRFTLATESFN